MVFIAIDENEKGGADDADADGDDDGDDKDGDGDENGANDKGWWSNMMKMKRMVMIDDDVDGDGDGANDKCWCSPSSSHAWVEELETVRLFTSSCPFAYCAETPKMIMNVVIMKRRMMIIKTNLKHIKITRPLVSHLHVHTCVGEDGNWW